MLNGISTFPFVALQTGCPYLAAAQTGFFVVAFVVYLLWPKHPRWMTNSYTVFVPTELFATLLTMAVIYLVMSP